MLRTALLAGLVATLACAGAGKRYDCPDGGADCARPDPALPGTPFLGQPAVVWRDGAHSASTDALSYGGAVYAAFRSAPAWSLDASAQVLVVRSADGGQTWTKTAALKVAGKDPRSPKLSIFQGKLLLTATVWDPVDPSLPATSVRLAASADGQKFAELAPADLGVPALEAWRPRAVGPALLFAAWHTDELYWRAVSNEFSLWSTGDGASFARLPDLPVGPGARQGDLVVRANGDLVVAVPERPNLGQPDRQTFCAAAAASLAAPAWDCWSVPRRVEQPALFEFAGVLYLAGRLDAGEGRRRTSVWQVDAAARELVAVADLPLSFGDTGAPGVVPLDEDHALVTYHATSSVDARTAALGHEPTELEAKSLGLPTDVLAVRLYMPAASAGR